MQISHNGAIARSFAENGIPVSLVYCARDIGAGLDTRGVKADGGSAGYFIEPGPSLPDGRSYALIDGTALQVSGGQ